MNKKIKVLLYIGVVFAIFIVLFTILYLVFYRIDSKKEKLKNEIVECAILYLNNKYGDYEFNVTNIEESYDLSASLNDAFFNKRHIGYKLSVSCNSLTDNFILNISGTTSQTMSVKSEEFVERYYDETTIAYFLENFDLLKIDLKIESEKIPIDLRTFSFI